MRNDEQQSIVDYPLAKHFPELADAMSVPRIRLVGNADLIGQPAIGICGSRRASKASLDRAQKFGELAADADLGVISGNARGVDEVAQRSVLNRGGWTVSVLAEGLGGWKPRVNHRPLVSGTNFLAVSCYDDAARWMAWRAMERNKLVIGLSHALVVVQAGVNGGTWAAGVECLRRNKPLLVVHGRTESSDTEGNRELIRRGGIRIETNNELRRVLRDIRRDPVGMRPQKALSLLDLP
ncbi:MAG: DNA-processing protein DprA [Chloroflexi bacterium]|nr:DNA-processing protein DprA [Chloroflexota bacterium]